MWICRNFKISIFSIHICVIKMFLFSLIWRVISFSIFSNLWHELALNIFIDFDKLFNAQFNHSWILCTKIVFLLTSIFAICFLLFFVFACYLFMIHKFWLTPFCFNIFASVFLFKSFFCFEMKFQWVVHFFASRRRRVILSQTILICCEWFEFFNRILIFICNLFKWILNNKTIVFIFNI